MELAEKRVLISGAARRTGRAIAKAFAEAGAKIFIHYNNSEQDAISLFNELGGAAAGHKLVQCDLLEKNCAEKIFKSVGDTDILVNNASIFDDKPIMAETEEDFLKQFRINFLAALALMKKFAAQKTGSERLIINILDQRINSAAAADASYSFSKKSLADATLAAALQWAPAIRVNGIAPGPVFPPPGMEKSKMEKTLKQVPLGRPVRIEDICKACLFLAENESVSGQILYVDCGQHLTR